MTMTPDEADTILEARMAAGPDWCPDDMRESIEHDALTTIAGMAVKYGVSFLDREGEVTYTNWKYETEGDARARVAALTPRLRPYARVVRRYVTTPEAIG